jgi:hypothetical protein
MTLGALPIEMWQQILDECVSLPDYLDPDCLPEVKDPLYDLFSRANPGVIVERQLKVLQSVCKGWYNYLAKSEYRFIRLVDIAHHRIPKEAVLKAIRIDCGLCDSTCQLCFPHGMPFRISSLFQSAGSEGLLAECPVQIIDGPLDDLTAVVAETLIDMYQNMPKLRVIINATTSQHGRIPALEQPLNSFDNLQFLFIISNSRHPPWPAISSPKLTTLSYNNEIQPFYLPVDRWDVPALRHLRFPLWAHSAGRHINLLIPVLEAVGTNLISLQIGSLGFSDATLPKRLWDLCPRLQRLDSCLCLCDPPPPFHPLHTISVFFPEIYRFGITILPFTTSVLNWPSLRRLILQTDWKLFDEVSSLEEDLLDVRDWLEECVVICDRHGVTVEDTHGISFKNSRLWALLR